MENPGDPIYKGFNLDDLNIDQFYLNIDSDTNVQEFFLYSSHKECFECPYTRVWVKDFEKLIQKTHNKFRISFTDTDYLYENIGHHCDLDYNFGEFGIYNATVQQDGCSITTVKEPVNIYLSILSVIGIYIVFFGLVAITAYVYHVYTSKDETNAKKTKKQRVLSIDTFRGISIAIMIFVNFGAGGYDILEHAVWNGLHLADLAFPWFMWIMGFCIPISLSSNFTKNISNLDMLKNILKRSIKLYALGLFLGSGDILSKMRLFGVLQRFGIVYFIVSVICIFCISRNAIEKAKGAFDDVKKLIKAWVVVLIILSVHVILLVFLTKTNCPNFYLGPGGLHKNVSHPHCTGGATGYVDELILGDHRYQFPTIYEVYEARPFDPEGILGCLPTIFHVFLGVQAGTTLLIYKNHRERLIRWLSWAVITGAIGGGLCSFSKEDGLIPVNKNLWSISFVMVTTCFALVVLSICYVLIDIKKWWSGKPFLYAGMNAILMYIGHSMTDGYFPIRWYLDDTRRTHFLCLIADVWGAGIWIFISYYLYKTNYFFVI